MRRSRCQRTRSDHEHRYRCGFEVERPGQFRPFTSSAGRSRSDGRTPIPAERRPRPCGSRRPCARLSSATSPSFSFRSRYVLVIDRLVPDPPQPQSASRPRQRAEGGARRPSSRGLAPDFPREMEPVVNRPQPTARPPGTARAQGAGPRRRARPWAEDAAYDPCRARRGGWSGAANAKPTARVNGQVGLIRRHVDRELARSRTAGAAAAGGAFASAAATVERLHPADAAHAARRRDRLAGRYSG